MDILFFRWEYYSEVHKAKRKGELLALKRILMHNENEGIPITALREIKILRRLRHENIVPLIDIAVNPGKFTGREWTDWSFGLQCTETEGGFFWRTNRFVHVFFLCVYHFFFQDRGHRVVVPVFIWSFLTWTMISVDS